MKRLTKKGHLYTYDQVFRYICSLKIAQCLNRLRQYEDTGLTPDQICEIDKLYAEKCREVAELRKTAKRWKWIPCSESMPIDHDNRFYMCILKNHEEDPPMICQYEEYYGFGFWHDIYDVKTLGYVDSGFTTNEELGYEKVIAWMPLPEPYRE